MSKQEDVALLKDAIKDLREALGLLSEFHGMPGEDKHMKAVDDALRKINRVRNRK